MSAVSMPPLTRRVCERTSCSGGAPSSSTRQPGELRQHRPRRRAKGLKLSAAPLKQLPLNKRQEESVTATKQRTAHAAAPDQTGFLSRVSLSHPGSAVKHVKHQTSPCRSSTCCHANGEAFICIPALFCWLRQLLVTV